MEASGGEGPTRRRARGRARRDAHGAPRRPRQRPPRLRAPRRGARRRRRGRRPHRRRRPRPRDVAPRRDARPRLRPERPRRGDAHGAHGARGAPRGDGWRFVVLDLARVADVDLTATRILAQAEARLAARGGLLLLAGAKAPGPLGAALDDAAQHPRRAPARILPGRDEALEWCEERILEAHLPERPSHLALPLGELQLLAGLDLRALAALEGRVRIVRAKDGDRVFRAGDPGEALFLVRLGRVRLVVPAERGRELMLGVLGRGDVVGELAFVDGRRRSADAVACAETELYQLTREAFEAAAREVPALREELPARLNRVLTFRLRVTTQQLRAAEE